MENQEKSNMLHRLWKKFADCAGCNQLTSESRILDIERAERSERAALTQHAERLCAAEKARNEAVLERLGRSTQRAPQPSPQLPAFSRSTKSFVQERRKSPLPDLPRLDMEDIYRDQKSPESLMEVEDIFWEKVRLGSKMAVLACKEAQMSDRGKSPAATMRSESNFSSVDAHTPCELKAIHMIGSPAEVTSFKRTHRPPQPAPLCRRRVSRLPVPSARLSNKHKEVGDGCRLQSATSKVEALMEKLEHLQLRSIPPTRPPLAAKRTLPVAPLVPSARLPPAAKRTPLVAPVVPSFHLPVADKGTPAVAPLVPSPPAVTQTKRGGTRLGVVLRPAKGIGGAGKKRTNDCNTKIAIKKAELQPLINPAESLCLSFELLSSDDWEKKIDGLKTMQALAQHHSGTLRTKLHEVCLVLIEEVKNLRSAVSCAAMDTIAELYVHLQKVMDPEVEGTGRALLLKLASSTSAFIQQQANLALDAMVDNCSYGRIVSALLNTGLSHRCVAVRASAAQHLHRLADSSGAVHIMTAGKSLTERVLTAVSKMSVDAAPKVRHHGQAMLHELALQKDFLNLWTKVIPEKERLSLDKILKKAM